MLKILNVRNVKTHSKLGVRNLWWYPSESVPSSRFRSWPSQSSGDLGNNFRFFTEFWDENFHQNCLTCWHQTLRLEVPLNFLGWKIEEHKKWVSQIFEVTNTSKNARNQMFSLQENYHDQAEVLLTFVGPPNLLQVPGGEGMSVSSGNIGNRCCGSSWILSGRTESQRQFALLQHVTTAVHRCQGWMDQLWRMVRALRARCYHSSKPKTHLVSFPKLTSKFGT